MSLTSEIQSRGKPTASTASRIISEIAIFELIASGQMENVRQRSYVSHSMDVTMSTTIAVLFTQVVKSGIS